MIALARPFGTLHVRIDGPEDGPAVLFANSLGTDLRLWDKVIPLIASRHRVIRYDKRGHGLSALGGGECLQDHVDDAVAIITGLARGPVLFVGLSIGGLIAQSVAHQRPDLVRALVLSNTAARLGTAESWAARIAAIEAGGMDAIADAVMERWFAPTFRERAEAALWRAMLIRTPQAGYIAACQALAAADQTAATATLRLPVLALAGEKDGASPPPLVRTLAKLIPGSAFHEIAGAGHLPCVETPAAWAARVVPFLETHG